MHLLKYIESQPWAIGATILVSLFVAIAILVVLSVRYYIPPTTLKKHHDVAGFVFTNLGVLYAVLLGFTVVTVQQRFDKTKESIEIEASYLAEIYKDAEVFPQVHKAEIQNAVKAYSQSIVSEEWELIANKQTSPATIKALNRVWQAFYQMDPKTQKEAIWYTESINKLNQLVQTRMTRILSCEESLGSEMWSLLILGGIIITGFITFFGIDNSLTHSLMAAILAASTAFLLFLIYSLDTAFNGSISASPAAIQKVLETFK